MKSLDLYRAIQAAAIAAPTTEQREGRAFVEYRYHQSLAMEYHFQADEETDEEMPDSYMATDAYKQAIGELIDSDMEQRWIAEKYATFKHAAGRVKLLNTRERLQAFAAEMLKGGAWALWGGGEKPAETIKPKKARAVTWKASLIKVAGEAMEENQYSDFLDLAMDQLGGRAYATPKTSFILYAPDYAEGLPAGFAVARMDSGVWLCCHMESGISVGRGERVKSRALQSGIDAIESAGPEKLAAALARITAEQTNHVGALDAWRLAHGLPVECAEDLPAEEVASEEAAPMSDVMADIVATAPSTQEQAPEAPRAAKPTGTIWGKPVGLWILKCPSGRFAYVGSVPDAIYYVDGSTPEHIEKGQRLGGRFGPKTRSFSTHEEAAAYAMDRGFVPENPTPDAAQNPAEVASTESTQAPTPAAIVSASLAIGMAQASSTQAEEVSEESTEAAEACELAEACETVSAIGQTPAEQAGGPSDYMYPLKTQAQASDYTRPRETLRADYLRAADGGHVQHASSKTGAWSAVMFRTSDGAAGLAFKRPGLPVEILEHSSGPDRMRALQALARTAEQEAGAAAAQARATDSPQAAYLRQLASGLTPDEMMAMARDLEHDNYHGAALKWRCMAAGAFDLAARAAASITAQDAAGYLTSELGRERAAIADDLRARAIPPTDYTEALKTQGTDCSTPVETQPGGALSIRLERWEGLSDECGQPVTVASFAEADALLMRWSETAPAAGGYNKCGYLVTWPDGKTYSGRYDLVHHTREKPSLCDDMASGAEYQLGKRCPLHMSEARYFEQVSSVSEEHAAKAAALLGLLATHAGYFPRSHPAHAPDLLAMVERLGIAAGDLVGLGVVSYSPDSGRTNTGAITAAEVKEWAGRSALVLITTYEDGTQQHMDARSFEDKAGDRFARHRVDMRRHGAPYLAELAAAAASKKASDSSTKEMKQQAHARQIEALAAEFPHLERADSKHGGGQLAARNIRKLLKAAFKGVKFSVTSDYNSTRVRWTDGPTSEQVNDIIGRFDIGRSDTQSDYFYTEASAWSEMFGGVQYLTTCRDHSDEMITQAIAAAFDGCAQVPSLADWHNGAGLLPYWGEGEHARRLVREHLDKAAGASVKA